MSNASTLAPTRRTGVSVSIGALAWAAVVLLFLSLRLAPIWQAPVGGFELDGLSGALMAQHGDADSRFAGTLAQWIATLTLSAGDSEVPARILTYLVAATIPVAFYLARARIGEVTALAAVALLALDGTLIHLTSAATPSAFDVAVTVWLFVGLLHREDVPWWAWGVAGAVLMLSGPIALPLAAGAVVLFAPAIGRAPSQTVIAIAVGVLAGLVLGLIAPGGISVGVVPLNLLADGFERTWSSSTVAELALVYNLPLILFAAAAAVWLLTPRRSERDDDLLRLVALWSVFALAWFLASLASHQPLPNAAVAIPAAVLVAMALPDAIRAVERTEWITPSMLIPVAFIGLVMAYVPLAEWGERGDMDGSYETVTFAAGILIAVLALGFIAFDRATRPALLAFAAIVGLLLMARGAFGVALSAMSETLPSPVAAEQADDLVELLRRLQTDRAGTIVVNDEYRAAATWPLRELDGVTFASQAPADAAILVWTPLPTPPDGYIQIQGTWSLTQRIEPPTADVLDYVNWIGDANSNPTERTPAAVYLRDAE